MITVKSTHKLRILVAVAVMMFMGGAAFPETYIVTNTSDSDPAELGSLRWAIESANENYGPDSIEFEIENPQIIKPLSALPGITDSVVIDGYTQEGASPATAATPAVLPIVLDGSMIPDTKGLSINGGVHDCAIRGLKIRQFRLGIGVAGHDNSIEGNHILDGVFEGIGIMGAYNAVGGAMPEQRNVVTGNNVAIWISPSSGHNHIQGNYLGTDVDGQYDMSIEGMEGVAIGASHNTVADNVISGYEQGVNIIRWSGEDPLLENNVIERNKIGTNADGTSPIPNGSGIRINTGVNTTVKGNLITGNAFSGVVVENDLPHNSEEDLAVGNLITQNAIYDNGELGINLVRLPVDPGWVTPNDPGDGDTGPNNLMNFPELTSARATPGKLIVQALIDTQNPRQVRVEFFANSTADPTGYGEGEIFLGTATPNTKGKFTATLSPVSPGMWISATATDPDNNTSEFALSIVAEEPGGKK